MFSNIFVSDFDSEIIGLLLAVMVLVLLMLLLQLLPELPHALVPLFTLNSDELRCSQMGDASFFDAELPASGSITIGSARSAHAKAALLIESQLTLSFLMVQPVFGAAAIACDVVTHILRARSIDSAATTAPASSARLNGHDLKLLTILIVLWFVVAKYCGGCDGDLQFVGSN